jgi:hypothetical protein
LANDVRHTDSDLIAVFEEIEVAPNDVMGSREKWRRARLLRVQFTDLFRFDSNVDL